jgi:hypothetical protein
MFFITEQEVWRRGWRSKLWIIGGNTLPSLLSGISTHMRHVRQHGMTSLFLDNINSTVIMNQRQILAKAYISDSKDPHGVGVEFCKLQLIKPGKVIPSPGFLIIWYS